MVEAPHEPRPVELGVAMRIGEDVEEVLGRGRNLRWTVRELVSVDVGPLPRTRVGTPPDRRSAVPRCGCLPPAARRVRLPSVCTASHTRPVPREHDGRATMKRVSRVAAVAALTLVGGTLAGTGVLAATGPSDEAALAPTRRAAHAGIERKVDALLAKMTTTEKLQQVQLLSDGQVTDADAEAGVGGVFSLVDPAKINHLQHIAVEQSRLHIPILFAYDTIHGYRTIFPVPLGAASSFDPQVAADRRHDRRPRVRDGRAQAGLQPDGRRLPRAPLGPHRRGQRRGPVPRLRDGGRPGQGRAGQPTTPPRDKVVASVKHFVALRPAGGRPRLQHHRHVRVAAAQPLPPAVQGRDRRGRGHGDVLVQLDQRRARLREPATPRPTSSRRSGASTGSSRATTPRSRRPGPARR